MTDLSNVAPDVAQQGAAVSPASVRRVGILGTGGFVPERILTNADLEELVDTTDEWIVSRTGMRERHIAAPEEATSDLAIAAGRAALARAGVAAEDVDLVLVATITPDHTCPATAGYVQAALGATRAAGFDVVAACTGFITAMMTAHHLIAAGQFNTALVIGADTMSRITDYSDRESCILFGDGAGAVVLGVECEQGTILDHVLQLDGSEADLIRVPAGGSRTPASERSVADRSHFLQMAGREVFRFAVSKFGELLRALVARNGAELEDLALVVPHQANLRILETAARKAGIPMDKVFVNIERYGNTSAASIPLALHEAVAAGRLRTGDLVCTVGFGGGLTWGASLIRW